MHLCVCVCVRLAILVEGTNAQTLNLVCRSGLSISRSSSNVKVIGQSGAKIDIMNRLISLQITDSVYRLTMLSNALSYADNSCRQ